MSHIVQQVEEAALAGRTRLKLRPGDTVRVHVKIVEGSKERVQIYEGVVIAWKDAGFRTTMTVRKISYGVGVERVFPVYAPSVDKVEVLRHARVRRAKLYFLRNLRGKKARLIEQRDSSGDSAQG
jgi:large subunit ribosomal protein L19